MLDATYQVHMADGREFPVAVDQRDWAAMEAEQFPAGAVVTQTRYLAFRGARRAGQYSGTWAQWNTTDCKGVDAMPDVDDADESDSEGEQGANPGRPAPSAGSTSRSSGQRGSRSRKS